MRAFYCLNLGPSYKQETLGLQPLAPRTCSEGIYI